MDERFLSKAKRIHNGKWVTGFVVQAMPETSECYIVPQVMYNGDEIKDLNGFYLRFDTYYKVDPLTVCKCTGVKNINGSLIFEDEYKEQLGKMIELCEKQMRSIKLVTGFTDIHLHPQIVKLKEAKEVFAKED